VRLAGFNDHDVACTVAHGTLPDARLCSAAGDEEDLGGASVQGGLLMPVVADLGEAPRLVFQLPTHQLVWAEPA